jgi:hypothetical protein
MQYFELVNIGVILSMKGNMHFMISSSGREPDNIVPISTHGFHQILVYRPLDPSWNKKKSRK